MLMPLRSTLFLLALFVSLLSAIVARPQSNGKEGRSMRIRRGGGARLASLSTPRSIDPRQAKREEIVARANRVSTGKRAYASTSPCGGFAGQQFRLTSTSTGQTTFAQTGLNGSNRIRLAMALMDSSLFTLDPSSGACRMLRVDNGDVLTVRSSVRNYAEFVNPANIGNFAPVICAGSSDNTLSCSASFSSDPSDALNTFCDSGFDGEVFLGTPAGCAGYTTVVFRILQ